MNDESNELNPCRVHEYRRRPSLSAVDCRKLAMECFSRRVVDPVARKDFWYWARLAREKSKI
jgi:hypothetical protein